MLCCGQLPKGGYIHKQSITLGRGRGRNKIAGMNKSVLRHCGSCGIVMLIISWWRLLKAFEKSGMDICCVAVSNCLENCLFHVKFRVSKAVIENVMKYKNQK